MVTTVLVMMLNGWYTDCAVCGSAHLLRIRSSHSRQIGRRPDRMHDQDELSCRGFRLSVGALACIDTLV